jgi:hypothetical protein
MLLMQRRDVPSYFHFHLTRLFSVVVLRPRIRGIVATWQLIVSADLAGSIPTAADLLPRHEFGFGASES